MRLAPFVRRPSARAALGVLALLAAACSDDDGDDVTAPPQTGGVAYAISTVGGVFPNQTTYIQGFASLPSGAVGNQNAIELSKSASMWAYGGALYVYSFGAPATMARYTFDQAGRPVKGAEMVSPGANTYSTIQFISPTEAYASLAGGLAKLVRFDPSTMRTLDEVDLSSLARPNANSLWYIGSHVRDGKLFLAVEYQRNSSSAFDSAYVAVIDLATRRLEKLIADGRTAMIFAAGLGVQAFVQDANGDIYVQGRGNKDAGGRKGSGILRIRRGETTFDPTYFFDLEQALGAPAYGLWHFPQENATFVFRAEDPTDMWDFKGPNYRLYRVNLATRTALGPVAGVPLTSGSSTQFMRRLEPGKIHFAVAGATEDAIYAYTVSTGQVAKLFTSTGGRFSGFEKLR